MWLSACLGGLVFVAVVVAWWEHLGSGQRAGEAPREAAMRVVSVDVEIDRLDDPPAPETPGSDSADRRQAMSGAMARMIRAADTPQRWVDTAPMIGPGALLPAAVHAAAQREFSPSQQP